MKMCEKCKDKKIFICHVYGMNNEYSILAKDNEECKKIMVNYLNNTYRPSHTVPFNNTDVYCMDIESIKEHMLNNNTEIEVL